MWRHHSQLQSSVQTELDRRSFQIEIIDTARSHVAEEGAIFAERFDVGSGTRSVEAWLITCEK